MPQFSTRKSHARMRSLGFARDFGSGHSTTLRAQTRRSSSSAKQTPAKRLNLREAVRPSSHDSLGADFVGGAVSGVPSTPGFGVMGWKHLARDVRIFDCNVAVREAPAALFERV